MFAKIIACRLSIKMQKYAKSSRPQHGFSKPDSLLQPQFNVTIRHSIPRQNKNKTQWQQMFYGVFFFVFMILFVKILVRIVHSEEHGLVRKQPPPYYFNHSIPLKRVTHAMSFPQNAAHQNLSTILKCCQSGDNHGFVVT